MLPALNFGRTVKIRYTKSSSGKIVLYLEHYTKESREKFYPGVALTLEDAKRDEEILRYAALIRDDKEKLVLSGIPMSHTTTSPGFLPYAWSIAETKNRSQGDIYRAAIVRFDALFPRITIEAVSEKHAVRYMTSISALTTCTQDHYCRVMRACFKKAIKDKLITCSPFADISVRVKPGQKKFLTQAEVKKIEALPPSEIRNAFLFSCYTGLRWGDVKALQMSDIREGYLYYQMKKTGSYERVLLPSAAFHVLVYTEGLAFRLPGHRRMMKHLSALISSAGIDKHITFHCARHTFATLCLTLGIDIYTVSKLLGHSDVRVTQVYAKLVDSKKDEAMRTLSRLGDSEPG